MSPLNLQNPHVSRSRARLARSAQLLPTELKKGSSTVTSGAATSTENPPTSAEADIPAIRYIRMAVCHSAWRRKGAEHRRQRQRADDRTHLHEMESVRRHFASQPLASPAPIVARVGMVEPGAVRGKE